MALYIGIKNLIGKGAAWLRSKWSTIFTQLKATFRYRVAGGSDNSSLPERNGRAVIDTIYGSTVKWNQVINPLTQTIATSGLAGEITLTINNDGSITANGTTTANRYFRLVFGQKNKAVCIGMGTTDSRINYTDGYVRVNAGKKSVLYSDFKANDVYIYFAANKTYTNLTLYPQCNVLTDIFGTNAEIATNLGITEAQIDTDTGAAAFEAWLALNVGTQDYYPYDEGSLLSFKGQGVKSVGFNKFDGTFSEEGKYLYYNGTEYNGNDNNISSYIKIMPGQDYYLTTRDGIIDMGNYSGLCWYDFNKQFISGEAFLHSTGKTFTAPSNAAYVRFTTIKEQDYILNLSDPAKNGTYKPYKEEVVDLSGAYINVWDEIPAYGTFSVSNGETFTPNSGYLASQNKIKVVGGKTYYFKINQSFRVFYYDASGTFISSTPITATETSINLDSNVGYIRFQRGAADTYQHNICINVSNADINGTYFPHALQKVGSVTDEDTETELTKKIFAKKLKDLTWSYSSSAQCMYAPIAEMLSRVSGDNRIVLSIAKYTPDSTPVANTLSNITNMCYRQVGQNLGIKDTNYGSSDISQFVSDLGDTEIQFELATPITIPHDTPMQYAVDKYSTEELLVPASVAGEPTSTALVADIEYQAK